METIEWKQVPSHPDYRISEDGYIESKMSGEWLPMRQSLSHYGYWVLNLRTPERKVVQHKVHRLVCLAFNGPMSEGKEDVNHKDGDKNNNHRSNLEWCSRGSNSRHALKNGLRSNQATVDVIVHNDSLGQVQSFEFRHDVTRHFGLNEYKLEKLMAGFPHLTMAFEGQLFRFEPLYRESSSGNRLAIPIRVKNYLTGEEFTSESVRLASIRTGINRFRLDKYLKRGTITSGHCFKLADDRSSWPDYSYEEAKASFNNL